MPLYAVSMPEARRGTASYDSVVQQYLSVLPRGSFVYNPGFYVTLDNLSNGTHNRKSLVNSVGLRDKLVNRGYSGSYSTVAFAPSKPAGIPSVCVSADDTYHVAFEVTIGLSGGVMLVDGGDSFTEDMFASALGLHLTPTETRLVTGSGYAFYEAYCESPYTSNDSDVFNALAQFKSNAGYLVEAGIRNGSIRRRSDDRHGAPTFIDDPSPDPYLMYYFKQWVDFPTLTPSKKKELSRLNA